MKKFFSLVLAVVMALSLTTVAWGVSVVDAAAAQTALDAATGDLTLTLTGDVTSRLVVDWRATLDYDEATPDYYVGGNPYYLATRDMGKLTVVGDGDTKFAGFQFVSNLTHENHHVDPDSLFVIDTLTIQDVVFEAKPDLATGGIGAATIDTLIFNGVTFVAGAYISNSSIENVVFVDCDFTGGVSAIEVTGADSDINVTVVDCEFENVDRAVLLSGGSYAGDITIKDNEMSCSKYAVRITTVTDDATLTITGNNATVTSGTAIKVDTIADGVAVDAWNNDWDGATVPAAMEDSNAALYDLYEGDDDLYVGGTIRTKVAAKKLTKTQAGQVAGWDIEGTLYVEITKAEATKADFYLTKHGKDTAILYLREAENHGVYTLTGKANKNFVDPDEDPFCGQWNLDPVTDKLYVDDKDGDFYVAGTDAYMLVGGTVVGVELADMDLMVPHEMEGVYDAKDKLVGVECVVCDATGKVYASVDKVPFGADYDYFEGLPYVLNKIVVKPSTDTDKVTSAETFDAGIAMYVGMSVMAAAGSAVLIGKKKD